MIYKCWVLHIFLSLSRVTHTTNHPPKTTSRAELLLLEPQALLHQPFAPEVQVVHIQLVSGAFNAGGGKGPETCSGKMEDVWSKVGLPGLVNIQKAIENGPVEMDFPINSMVIFHSYVKLPEGKRL